MLFVGKPGDILREALKSVGVSPDTLYVTTKVPCYPEKAYDDETIRCATACCHTNHVHEVTHQHPRGVILFDERHGWQWDTNYETWTLGTIHPLQVVRDPSLLSLLVEDLAQLKIGPPGPRNQLPDVKYALVEDELDVANLYDCIDILNSSLHTIDIETTGLDAQDDEVICLGIAANPHDIWIVTAPMIPHIKELLEDEDLNWVGHNVYQFDCKFLEIQYGIKCKPKYDTMLMSYCLDERPWGHSLKAVAMEYFHIPNWSVDMDMSNLAKYAPEILYEYLAYDCHFTWSLVEPLLEEMDEEEVTHIHNTILIPAARTLAQIEMRGARIDQDYLRRKGDELVLELTSLHDQLAQEAGTGAFNPNSRQQVQRLLYDILEIPTDDRRVDKLALENIDHPVVDLLMEYKLKYKLLSTFIIGLLGFVKDDERIHGHFLLHATVTGRLSMRAPNLQNMPVVTGSIIRDAFIAPPGKVLLEVDYAQLELKIAAWYSQDSKLQAIYKSKGDAHVLAAAEMYHVPVGEVTKEQRYHAKHVAFGILYGRGANSLALSILHCSPQEAQRFINAYFKQFNGLWKWIRKMQRQALRLGYVRSAFGRKRRFPAILSEHRGDIERKASNMPIQSMASDICLAGLIRLEELLDPNDAEIILTVHDSVLLNVCPNKVSYIIKTIRKVFEEAVPFADEIPLTVDFTVGERWGSLVPYDEWRERGSSSD